MDFSERNDLPIGFSMNLAQDAKAMSNFAILSDYKKEKLVEYIEEATTGDEAKNRIIEVVSNLHHDKTN